MSSSEFDRPNRVAIPSEFAGPRGLDADLDTGTVVAPPSGRNPSVSIATLLTLFITALLAVRFLVPSLIEEYQFRLVRGQQRGLHDAAKRNLTRGPIDQLSDTSRLVTQRISPSVVHIDTQRNFLQQQVRKAKLPLNQLEPRETSAQGAGVIVHERGHILTNFHVVAGADSINVTTSDDRRLPATVVGVDTHMDLALLQVEAHDLIAADWGDSDTLAEGSLVWAIGSPFGLSRSVTFGVLSAKGRGGLSGQDFQHFLQSDAAVSPGNSGGPLVDEWGRVVGINTAIVGPTYQGVSFAIPSREAREVYEKLAVEEALPQGWLGVQLAVVESGQPRIKAVSPAPLAGGAKVKAIVDTESCPARVAGLTPGDIITRWNEHEVDSPSTLSQLIAQSSVGTTVDVTVCRGETITRLRVTVGERPLQFTN